MRGIIRYLSRCKRLKVRAYFPHFMTPSVSSLSSKFLPRFFFLYIFILFFLFSLFAGLVRRQRRHSLHLICALVKVL